MGDKMLSVGSKAQFVADVLNRTLATLITRCSKAEGVRDYFHIGVIAYNGSTAYNGFQGGLGQSMLNPISAIEASPLRIEERNKKTVDGAGGIIEQPVKFPVWFEPVSDGATPMCGAIRRAAEELVPWCDAHVNSYPPTVLHITDGESTDGDPEPLATQMRQIQTNDGPVLMFNLCTSTASADAITWPASETGLPSSYAKVLFRMSSPLPEHQIRYAQEKGYQVSLESRAFIFNAHPVEIVDFFDIGTRASQLR
jgi:hypothetical protein